MNVSYMADTATFMSKSRKFQTIVGYSALKRPSNYQLYISITILLLK